MQTAFHTHHLQTSQRTETISHSLANTNNVIPPTDDPPEVRGEQSCDHDNDSYTCFCGRKCAGLRGFKLTNGHVEFLIYQIYDLCLNLARIPNQILMILKRQTPIHVRTSNMKECPNYLE